MKILKTILSEDRVIKTGLVLVLASAALFGITETNLFELSDGSAFGAFFINYVFSVTYFFVVVLERPKRLGYWVLLFILWFISAFALNRCMTVFDISVPWLCVVICLSCIALISALFMEQLNTAAKHIVIFLLGAAFLLFAYYSLYLTSMYIMGLIAAIAIGISLHVFAPVGLAIVTFIVIRRN